MPPNLFFLFFFFFFFDLFFFVLFCFVDNPMSPALDTAQAGIGFSFPMHIVIMLV